LLSKHRQKSQPWLRESVRGQMVGSQSTRRPLLNDSASTFNQSQMAITSTSSQDQPVPSFLPATVPLLSHLFEDWQLNDLQSLDYVALLRSKSPPFDEWLRSTRQQRDQLGRSLFSNRQPTGKNGRQHSSLLKQVSSRSS
jgi:hypothetical protein